MTNADADNMQFAMGFLFGGVGLIVLCAIVATVRMIFRSK